MQMFKTFLRENFWHLKEVGWIMFCGYEEVWNFGLCPDEDQTAQLVGSYNGLCLSWITSAPALRRNQQSSCNWLLWSNSGSNPLNVQICNGKCIGNMILIPTNFMAPLPHKPVWAEIGRRPRQNLGSIISWQNPECWLWGSLMHKSLEIK